MNSYELFLGCNVSEATNHRFDADEDDYSDTESNGIVTTWRWGIL